MGGGPPRFVRAVYYRYRFADPQERKATGAYWKRTRLGEYLPAVEASSLVER
jgi:lipase maturation factor